MSLQVLHHIDRIESEQTSEKPLHTTNPCDPRTQYKAAESAALSGKPLGMHAADLLSGANSNDASAYSDMHGGHACLMMPFTEAVAVAWAASTPSRGCEPSVATDENGDSSPGSQRAQRAQQARQEAPHVQAALTFVLLLCMAALGGEAVDSNSQLLSNILLVCVPSSQR